MKTAIFVLMTFAILLAADACGKYEHDIIAQATCGGLCDDFGHVYAVRRPCPSKETCEDICKSDELKAQDSQVAKRTGSCQGALHVYRNRPKLTGDKKLGPKIYRYGGCTSTGCGPNYCCCRFI